MELLNDSRYFDPPIQHEEDGCEKCHAFHEKEHIFDERCGVCNDQEKCDFCNGTGYYADAHYEDNECLKCETTGRTWK